MEENQASRCSSSSATAHAKHTAGERKKRKKKWKKEKSRLSIVNLNSFFFLLQLLSQPVSVPAELSTSAPQLNFPLSFGWCVSISSNHHLLSGTVHTQERAHLK